MSVQVRLPGTGRVVSIATLEEYNGNRNAWGKYLYATFGQSIERQLDGLLVWQDGEGQYKDPALAKQLRLDLDFFTGIALKNISGDIVLPAIIDNAIPPELDRPLPKSTIGPNNVIPSQLGPSMTPPPSAPHGGTSVRYRFFIESNTPYHRYDTGANVSTCSRANPNGCAAIQFRDPGGFEAMKKYAADHGETLIRVSSIEEAFNIIEGKAMPNPSNVVNAGDAESSIGFLALIPILGFLFRK